MAQQDLGRGWGGIDSKYSVWVCPVEGINYPVSSWTVCNGVINGHILEGRRCPQGDFEAYQHGDALKMIPTTSDSKTIQANQDINTILAGSTVILATATASAIVIGIDESLP